MKHDLELDGYAFRLRPIGDGDAGFVVGLRTDSTLGRYLHATSQNVEEQLAWFQDYYRRSGDFYFVIERKGGAPEGLVGLYDVDKQRGTAEWGRWILRRGSVAAVESAWLIYRMAFDVLTLDTLYCRTVAENRSVVSFHDSCGITDREVLPGHFVIRGVTHDAVQHRVKRSDWIRMSPLLENLSRMTARKTNA